MEPTNTHTNTIRTIPVRERGAASPVVRRRHPARKSRAAAVGLTLVSTGVLSGVFAANDRASAATAAKTTTAAATASYTGATSSNRWGTVQVKITVAKGRITDVKTLQLPSGHMKSVRLSNNAATVLRSEVLSAQSTSVDTVSGATMTSNSYLDSLQSAIDQARAAGTL